MLTSVMPHSTQEGNTSDCHRWSQSSSSELEVLTVSQSIHLFARIHIREEHSTNEVKFVCLSSLNQRPQSNFQPAPPLGTKFWITPSATQFASRSLPPGQNLRLLLLPTTIIHHHNVLLSGAPLSEPAQLPPKGNVARSVNGRLVQELEKTSLRDRGYP